MSDANIGSGSPDNQPKGKPAKGGKAAKSNGQATAETQPTPEEDPADLEAAVSEPNGAESPELPPESVDEALAEIEEAIGDGDDEDSIEVEESNLSYPIRKPLRSKKKFEFFMTHPDPALWIKAWVVINGQEMEEEYYLPTANVKGDLLDHLVHIEFVPCITSRGKIFICPVPCDEVTGRKNKWTDSLRTAMRDGRTRLTKILSGDEGKYRIFHPKGKVPLPEWTEDFTRRTMLARMFNREHVLRDLDNDMAREILNAGGKIEK